MEQYLEWFDGSTMEHGELGLIDGADDTTIDITMIDCRREPVYKVPGADLRFGPHVPPGYIAGLIFVAAPRGHLHGRCSRRRLWWHFCPHRPPFGTWPLNVLQASA